jgi:hypothetical protein
MLAWMNEHTNEWMNEKLDQKFGAMFCKRLRETPHEGS